MHTKGGRRGTQQRRREGEGEQEEGTGGRVGAHTHTRTRKLAAPPHRTQPLAPVATNTRHTTATGQGSGGARVLRLGLVVDAEVVLLRNLLELGAVMCDGG